MLGAVIGVLIVLFLLARSVLNAYAKSLIFERHLEAAVNNPDAYLEYIKLEDKKNDEQNAAIAGAVAGTVVGAGLFS